MNHTKTKSSAQHRTVGHSYSHIAGRMTKGPMECASVQPTDGPRDDGVKWMPPKRPWMAAMGLATGCLAVMNDWIQRVDHLCVP